MEAMASPASSTEPQPRASMARATSTPPHASVTQRERRSSCAGLTVPLPKSQWKSTTVEAASELRVELEVDMAAASTPATISPLRPVGRCVTMKVGKMRSGLSNATPGCVLLSW